MKFVETTWVNDTHYLDMNRALSYNSREALVHFFVGARGCGKTFGAKKLCLRNFAKKHAAGKHRCKFAWVRYDETDVKKMCDASGHKFFSDLYANNLIPPISTTKIDDKGVKVTELNHYIASEAFYFNKELCGYLLNTSQWATYKGNDYSDVDIVVFEEVMQPLSKVKRFEISEAFSNMYETIVRTRDTRCLVLSNLMYQGHPIFSKFGFDRMDKFGLYITDDAVLQYIQDSDSYKEEHANSKSGRLSKILGTDEMIVGNKNTNTTANLIAADKVRGQILFVFMTAIGLIYVKQHGDKLYVGEYNGWWLKRIWCKEKRYCNSNTFLMDTNLKSIVKQIDQNPKTFYTSNIVYRAWLELLPGT